MCRQIRGRKPGNMAYGVTTQTAQSADEVLLAVSAVSKRFGGVRAVEEVAIVVQRGEIASIIGPNGAGQTSLLNMIRGFYGPKNRWLPVQGRYTAAAQPGQTGRTGSARPV